MAPKRTKSTRSDTVAMTHDGPDELGANAFAGDGDGGRRQARTRTSESAATASSAATTASRRRKPAESDDDKEEDASRSASTDLTDLSDLESDMRASGSGSGVKQASKAMTTVSRSEGKAHGTSGAASSQSASGRKRKAKKADSDEESAHDGDAQASTSTAPKARSTAKKAKTEGGAPPKKKKRSKKDATHLPPEAIYPPRDFTGRKFVGAHVSIAEGAHYAPYRALLLGATAFALFTKGQKQWAGKPLTSDSLRLFPLRCKGKTELEPDDDDQVETQQLADGRGFDPLKHVVPHGSYLTNLCNPDKAKNEKSYENFLDELKRAEGLGIGLFNFHPGSSTGACTKEESFKLVADAINRAHAETSFVVILLETMAGSNNVVGGDFKDLGAIIALVKDKARVGVCFDTCHCFAYGYDMRTPETYKATMDAFEEYVGLRYIRAFHVNDSREGCGAHRDLHENIGAGQLGLTAFHLLMRDERFDGRPFILETPMISGSLRIEASPSKASASPGAAKLEETDVDLHDAVNGAGAANGATQLTLGGSTWKLEIQLLQEMEKCPVGESTSRLDALAAQIVAIASASRAREAAAAAQRKTAKQAAKETAEPAAGGSKKQKALPKKGKAGEKVKKEESEEEEEVDELGSSCGSDHEDEAEEQEQDSEPEPPKMRKGKAGDSR